MVRGLRNLACLVSLLLCLAAGTMRVRSYWVGDVWEWNRVTRDERIVYAWYLKLASGAGGIGVSRDAEDYDLRSVKPDQAEETDWSLARRQLRPPAYPQAAFFAGANQPSPTFAFRWKSGRAGTRSELILPYWAVVLLFAIAPGFGARQVWVNRRARRRQRANECPACGYDLRASPERCPECGRTAVGNREGDT